MKHYFFFLGFANLAILLSFITENLFSKFSLLIIGLIWLIFSIFAFRSETELKRMADDLDIISIRKDWIIMETLQSILRELKGGKDGKTQRNSKRNKPKGR